MLTRLLVAFALLASATPTLAAPGDVDCYYRDVVCYCADNHEQRCSGLGGNSCAYSIGPTPATQVAVVCDANPLPTDGETRATTSQDDSPHYMCVIRDFVCYCTATTEYSCPDITGDPECGASAGPTPGIQVGVMCPFDIGSDPSATVTTSQASWQAPSLNVPTSHE